jgi:hypothetical protein
MRWPTPTRKDHEAFCQVEGWLQIRDARGRSGTHHVTYELDLHDGGILRTRISHPVDRTDYGPSLWSHILRDQLRVAEPAFWDCVRSGTLPDRGGPSVPDESLPADVVYLLISRVGMSEREIGAMSRAEAVARLQRYWIEGS